LQSGEGVGHSLCQGVPREKAQSWQVLSVDDSYSL